MIPVFALAALLCGGPCAADERHEGHEKGELREFGHIVVIYQENHSFDNLYGLWGDVDGRRVNGVDFARASGLQIKSDGTALSCLLQNDVNLTSPPLAASCNDTTGLTPPTSFSSAFKNAPFKIDDVIAATDKTCAAPGASSPNGTLKDSIGALPGGCTRDIVHRFYSEQFQINGGNQNRYVLGSDAAGLAMGYYDTTQLPIYRYLHEKRAPNYVIADNFFQGAFGGSFLNHQWLIAATTPIFANADTSGGANDIHSVLDANLMPTSTPLYVNQLGAAARDQALTQACVSVNGRPVHGAAVCGDYAINTIQPFTLPYAPGSADAKRLPPLVNPTIGDRMSARGVDWAWYSGGWSNAEGLVGAPGWTNGSGVPCADPNANPAAPAGRCPDKLFQYHHQAFNYFASFGPGTAARADHLRDEAEFVDAAKSGRLRQVSFVKPLGEENEHPGYTGEAGGSQHLVDLIKAVVNGPNGHDTLIIVTYDEFGGAFDHVPPPPHNQDRAAPSDQWGPGTRVPALLVSRKLEHSGVDHRAYDTTSILKLIEDRYNLAPLGARDAQVRSLRHALAELRD